MGSSLRAGDLEASPSRASRCSTWGAIRCRAARCSTTAHRRLRDLPASTSSATSRGNELTSGRADVVVCEGLLGNIVLQAARVGRQHGGGPHDVGDAAQRNWRWRAGMAIMARGADRLRALADYASYGGAPILGFEQVFIKAHRALPARSRSPTP